MGRVRAGSLPLKEAAELLELSYQQAKRVWARYRGGGAKALQYRNCGRRSNRAYPAKFRQAVLARVRERYADFGPTLASEHLGGGPYIIANKCNACAAAARSCTSRTVSHSLFCLSGKSNFVALP